LLYHFLKVLGRLALPIYCRKIVVNHPEKLDLQGPLLLAANHPNSFLDAILMGVLFKRKIHFLARGDAFASPRISRILNSLNILPVYRIIEGASYLDKNYETFDACVEKFKDGAIVMIFSEGLCRNEWKLRSLKKGTARLAYQAWDAGIPLNVLPVAINYSSFKRSGINVIINLGNTISNDVSLANESDGKKHLKFNKILEEELAKNIIQIEDGDTKMVTQKFKLPLELSKKIILTIPALIGYILHAPLYLLLKLTASKMFSKEPVHFSSIQFVLLFLIYPILLTISVSLLCIKLQSSIPLILMAGLPFTAWSYQQVKSTSP